MGRTLGITLNAIRVLITTEEKTLHMDEPEVDEEVKQLMDDHGVDDDVAEKAQELIDTEGLDEDEAIELAEEL